MKQIIFLFITLITSLNATAATITAKADRNPVQLNESFNLVFEAEGSVDDDPDFSLLKNDFTILNQSQGSSISIINGSYSKTTRWTLSMMARREGVLTIPSIAFGKDRSPELRLTVKPQGQAATGQGGDLFMELEASTKKTWVQGQIILTVKLFSARNISQFGISQPKVNLDSLVEQLGEDKRYQTRRGNTPYLAFERHYAIFPQQAGQLVIEPFVAEVEVSSSSSSYFDPFSRKSRIMRTGSESLEINVAGIPKQFSGKVWLPATKLELKEQWSQDPEQSRAGEPVTRTLSLSAHGLTSAQLPEFSMPPVNGLKQYPDQPLLNDHKQQTGITGERQEKFAIIPGKAGSYTLPAIEIPWWNTRTGKMEIARIKARPISAVPGDLNATVTNPATTATGTGSQPVVSAPQAQPASKFWVWLSLFLASGWFITGMFWWYSVRRQSEKTDKTTTRAMNQKQALQLVKKACQNNNAAACRQALVEWGKLTFSSQPGNLSELGKAAGEPLASCIENLNAALYSPVANSWSSQDLLAAVESLANSSSSSLNMQNNALEPLNKLNT